MNIFLKHIVHTICILLLAVLFYKMIVYLTNELNIFTSFSLSLSISLSSSDFPNMKGFAIKSVSSKAFCSVDLQRKEPVLN